MFTCDVTYVKCILYKSNLLFSSSVHIVLKVKYVLTKYFTVKMIYYKTLNSEKYLECSGKVLSQKIKYVCFRTISIQMLISLWEQDSHQPHVSYTVLYVKTKLWSIYLQLFNQLLTWLGLQFGTHPSVGTDHFCTCGVSSFGVKHKHKRQTWKFGKSTHFTGTYKHKQGSVSYSRTECI